MQIKHENLIKYIDAKVDKINKEIVVITEYVPGCSIKDIIMRFGKLNENLVAIYLEQILKALLYLHTNDLPHGNLKSTNILIDSLGKVKLTDYIQFSSSETHIIKQQDKDPENSNLWQDPSIKKDQNVDYLKSDVWNLGILLLEMCDGKIPEKESEECLDQRIPKIPQTLSNMLKTIISGCLVHDSKQRLNVRQLFSFYTKIQGNFKENCINNQPQIRNKKKIKNKISLVRVHALSPIHVIQRTNTEILFSPSENSKMILNRIQKGKVKGEILTFDSILKNKREQFNFEKKPIGQFIIPFKGDIDQEIEREIIT